MSDRKLNCGFFTISEYEKEQKWLAKQHKQGWKLRKATLPCFYTFERCKPEEVVYQLDYNKDGQEHKAEYIQMFQDCGWEYITDMAGYSYFRKPVSEMNGEEEIFCDDDSRLDMISRVFKGRIIPCIIIFFLVIIPQIWMQVQNPYTLNRAFNLALLGVYVGLFMMYVAMFLHFAVQYTKLKKRMGR